MPRTFHVLLALAVVLPPALAQQPARRARSREDWRVRSLKSRLKLSDAQVEQLRGLFDETRKATEQLKKQELDKLKALLTPDQRARQEAYEKQQAQRRERAAEARKLWMARWMGLDRHKYERELGLTPEQAQQVKAAVERANAAGIKQYNALTEGSDPRRSRRNWSDPRWVARVRALIDTGKKGARVEIGRLLNSEQKDVFAKLNARQDAQTRQSRERQDRWRERRRQQAERRRKLSPEQQLAQRVAAAVAALRLPGEEAAVLGPLIEKVLRYRASSSRKLEAQRARLRKLTEGSGDAAALRKRVAALRKEREAVTARLKTLQEGLRELLTFQQETTLIAHGVLD